MENLTIQTVVAQKIVRDAALEDIPLVADIEQMRWSYPTIVVRHYDFGKDLSLSEIRVIQQLAKVAATKCDCELHYTLDTLRFSTTEKPAAAEQLTGYEGPTPSEAVDDIVASWRYLKWRINACC